MKKISLIIISIMFFLVFPILSVSAHSSLLNVEYDECSWVVENNQDDEKWYWCKNNEMGHVFGLNERYNVKRNKMN